MAFFDEEVSTLSLRKTPDSISTCMKPDSLSQELWKWAKKIDDWGHLVYRLILICGAIVTIGIAFNFEFALSIVNPVLAILNSAFGLYGEDEQTILTITAVIASIFVWGLSAFLEYCVYHVIALLTAALASIVQSNKITSDLALYHANVSAGGIAKGPNGSYTVDDLGELARKKAQGLISDAEYAAKQSEILRHL